jgi:hypothetical protein
VPTSRRYACRVRTRPRVGKTLWFGPRRDGLGWGWTPVTWQGWVVVAVFVAAIVAAPWLLEGGVAAIGIAGALAGLLLVAWAKGSSPGGRRQAQEFDRIESEREAQRERDHGPSASP